MYYYGIDAIHLKLYQVIRTNWKHVIEVSH